MNSKINEKIFTDESAWQEEWERRAVKGLKRCARCLYDENTRGITFDHHQICNFCHTHDQLMQQYQGKEGRKKFYDIVNKIKREGKNKQYDIIVGVSGGADSSYMLYIAKELGLRSLAVHFDNTWNSTIAVENIDNVLNGLDIELWTHLVDNHEYEDLYRAILKAGVPDLEIPTDLALAATLNIAAIKHNIHYVFEGHSFKTEGISPLGWPYMDAKYLHSMHQQYGNLKKLHTYPYLWLSKQLKWMLWNRLKKIRPFWYIEYEKEDAKKMLAEKFGWQWYGGHHLENTITNFYHTYFLPRRFNRDSRLNGFSALVRSGQMEREEGLIKLATAPTCDASIVDLVKKRLGFSEQEFLELMTQPPRSYHQFKTYKPTFEKMRPFFYVMAKLNLVPMSFYLKYTKKDPSLKGLS